MAPLETSVDMTAIIWDCSCPIEISHLLSSPTQSPLLLLFSQRWGRMFIAVCYHVSIVRGMFLCMPHLDCIHLFLQSCQICSYLRVFAFVVPSTRNSISPNLCPRLLLIVKLLVQLVSLQRGFPRLLSDSCPDLLSVSFSEDYLSVSFHAHFCLCQTRK